MIRGYERVWAQIDLALFEQNLDAIADCLGDKTSLMGVIKTDGYGHGAVPLAKVMETKEYVSGFAVATVEEAFCLKRNALQKPVLVLGYAFPDCYDQLISQEIRAAVFTEEMLTDMSRAAERAGKKAIVHIAVDTGMSRIGIRPNTEGIAFVRKAMETSGIQIEGIFTHFATADERDKTRTFAQLERFSHFTGRIEEELGLRIPIYHCSNSAGIMDIRCADMDAVRAGIILYGLRPSDEVNQDTPILKPILSLYSKVAFVKDVRVGEEISYGGTFTAKTPMRVATIPLGYGDGYPRGLSNRADVLIGGRRARILGRICMDQFMVDVTHIPGVQVGDNVTLIGRDGDEEVTMEELGALSGRFHYEFACCLGKRIPRIYMRGEQIIQIRDRFGEN